jgi:hypothetical protein
MNEHRFHNEVMNKVYVSGSIILLAKQYLIAQQPALIDTQQALERFAEIHARPNPQEIVFTDTPTDDQINQTAQYLSYGLAFCEAVWSLVHTGYFYGSLDRHHNFRPVMRYIQVWPNQSSTTSVTFNDVPTLIPLIVRVNYSKRIIDSPEFVLFDPELFVTGIGDNLHPDVQEALQDAIVCFQHELYRPTVTLLGKAVEGAWVELGIALCTSASDQLKDADRLIEKLKNETNFMSRVQQVVKLYEGRPDLFAALIKRVSITQIKEISYWSDVVRDSRNAIHFGVMPTIPNSYDKTMVLLMSATSQLRTLYKLKSYAERA